MTMSFRGAPAARNLLSALCGAAALMLVAADASAQVIAITGGRVHPVNGAAIENGTVIIRDGKIAAVGANVAVPAGARRIDATGKVVTPGIVNAATILGLAEIPPVGTETNARGRDAIAAAFTVWEGLNPASVLIPPARDGGITSVLIFPQGGLVSGQAAIMQLSEGTASDMVIRQSAGMVINFGGYRGPLVGSRGELMLRLRELFEDVRAYRGRRGEYERAQTRDFVASRADLEALIPVIEGRLPVIMTVDRASDIEAALRLAQEYDLRLILAGAAEAWKVADKLAAARVPVLTGALNNIPGSFTTLGQRTDNIVVLRRAGVQVGLVPNGGGDTELFNVRNIRFEAGASVAVGMAWEDALRSITLTPAEMFGVGNRIGSLEVGKDADVVVWSGDPFEFASQPEHVIVRGREYNDVTRQDLLQQRYRTLPPNYRAP